MLRTSIALAAFMFAVFPTAVDAADGPKTLLERIAEWQYPGALNKCATISDAATVTENGDRTVPSIHCKAVLTTSAPFDKVVAYYKTKLSQKPKTVRRARRKSTASDKSRRCVTFHSDSDGRPVEIQVISINTTTSSTTLVISRARTEPKTHIAWSQYEIFNPDPDDDPKVR